MKINNLLLLSFFIVITFSSCGDDDNVDSFTLTEGVSITLRNTLENPGDSEGSYPSLFGQPDDAYDEFAVHSNSSIEFATALAQNGTPAGDVSGLYSIDFTNNTIEYTAIAAIGDPFWTNIADIFGVTPTGKFDRYYFTFSEPHNISGFTSSNSSVNLRIDSETVIVVEIGGGFDVSPDASFSLKLE